MGKREAVVAAATSPAEVIPADIAEFIGEPSLLETEVAADYDRRVAIHHNQGARGKS